MCQEDCGRVFRVAGVGLRMHVGVWEGAGGWIRVAGVTHRDIVHLEVSQRAFHVAGVGHRAF